MKRHLLIPSIVILAALAAACSSPSPEPQKKEAAAVPPEQARLQAMTARFAPVEITADVAGLPANERQALAKLCEAGWVMDALFLRQVWGGNEGLLMRLMTDRTPVGEARLHYFLINKGPWSRLDANAP